METTNGANMLKEISEIQVGLINTLSSFKDKLNYKLPSNFYEMFNRIHIIACGTSYHSGLAGKILIEKQLNIPCDITLAHEFSEATHFISSSTLYIFISQSGKTTDVLKAFDIICKYQLRSLAITNNENSILNKRATYYLSLKAGEELAVASTKAFNCQILAFMIFNEYIKSKTIAHFNKFINKQINTIKKGKFESLKLEEIKDLSNLISNYKTIYFAGSGFDYVLAKESALKIKETCYINTIAIPTMEIPHGTMAVYDNNSLVIIINNQLSNTNNTTNITNKIKETGAKVVLVSSLSKKHYKCNYDVFIQTPKLSNTLKLCASIIPFQYLAYHTSLKLGNNPDNPRMLTKAVI